VQFSIGFHAFLRSLQSVSINFELHFVSWLSVAGVLARNNSIILRSCIYFHCLWSKADRICSARSSRQYLVHHMARVQQGSEQPMAPCLSGSHRLVPEVVIRLGRRPTPRRPTPRPPTPRPPTPRPPTPRPPTPRPPTPRPPTPRPPTPRPPTLPPVSMPIPTRSSRNTPSDQSLQSNLPRADSQVSKRLTSKLKSATARTKVRSKAGEKDPTASKFAVRGVTSGRDKVGYSRNESPSLSSTSHDIHSSLPILSLHPSKPVVDSASNPLQPPLTESKNAATSISARNSSNQSTSISRSTSKSALPSLEHTKDCGVDVEDSQTFWGDDYIMANAMLGIESSGSDADADWDPTISTGGKDLSNGEHFSDANSAEDVHVRSTGKEPSPVCSVAKKASPGPRGHGGRFSQAQLDEVEKHAELFRGAMASLAKSWGCHISTLYRVAKVAGALKKHRRPNAWNSFQHQQKKLKKTPSGLGV
jgi:hypothetical protein